MNRESVERPFSLQGAIKGFGNTPINRLIEAGLEQVSGLRTLDRRYRGLPRSKDYREFLELTLDRLGVRFGLAPDTLERIPRDGPVVLVANHPFGGLEGVILAALLLERRPDFKIMANHLLKRIPEIRDLFIGVDPFGGKSAALRNLRSIKESIRLLQRGGLLAVFPAGEVSHWQPSKGAIEDPPWSNTVARIVRTTGATVLPLYFEGANGWLFQMAGLLHPRFRTALLPRELTTKGGKNINVTVGECIAPEQLNKFQTPSALTDYLRYRTYALGEQSLSRAVPVSETPAEPVIAPVEPTRLKTEVDALGPERCLVDGTKMRVYFARSAEIPEVVRELGRLRELTFRDAGEGTGKPIDIDRFDDYYVHLFVWSVESREIVGAYRLGLSDEILSRFGKRGFYSHSLFKYRTRLLKELGPAIELGRSFVRKEYQRSFSPLMLLWKGIARFVYHHPEYRVLFGPVSISSEYQTLSQQLMVEFLRSNNYSPELARFVQPRNPFQSRGEAWYRDEYSNLKDIESVSELVAAIEADDKGAPILLKQYLKLGGRLLGFNVDPDFNDALDGLIMVDLMKTDPRVLSKYMGREEAVEFLSYHQSYRQAS